MMFDALMMLGKGFVPDAHDEFMKFQYNLSDIDDPGVCAREYSWSDPEECCTRTARKACSRRWTYTNIFRKIFFICMFAYMNIHNMFFSCSGQEEDAIHFGMGRWCQVLDRDICRMAVTLPFSGQRAAVNNLHFQLHSLTVKHRHGKKLPTTGIESRLQKMPRNDRTLVPQPLRAKPAVRKTSPQ